MDAKTPLDFLFDVRGADDVEAAMAAPGNDADVWHCFDRIAHDRAGSFAAAEA